MPMEDKQEERKPLIVGGRKPTGMITPLPDQRRQIREALAKKWTGDYKKAIERMLANRLRDQVSIEWNHRREQVEDQRFFEGLTTGDDTLARTQPSQRDLKVNIIRKTGNFIGGLAKERATTGQVLVSGYGAYAPEEIALAGQEYQRRLGVIQQNTNWKSKRNSRIDDAVQCGVGYLYHHPVVNYADNTVKLVCEKPNWRNVYYDTSVTDMEDAEYCFVLHKMSSEKAKILYSWAKEFIETNSEGYAQSIPVGYEFYDILPYTSQSPHYAGYYGTGIDGRDEIVMGHAYYRETVMFSGHPRDIIVFVKFLADSGYERMEIVSKPILMGMERPPIVPLVHSRYNETGLPYSAVVRDRRGLARTTNSLLRNLLPLSVSRMLIANVSQLPQNLSEDTYMRGIANRIKQISPAIPEHGDKGNVRIEGMEGDMEKMMAVIRTVTAMAKDTSEVNVALLGEKGADSAAVLQNMKNDANIALTTFADNCDAAARADGEIVLSFIEQYNGYINFGVDKRGGEIISITSDGDFRIDTGRAYYQIEESNRNEVLQENFQKTIQAIISRSDPQAGMGLLGLFIKSLNLPNGQELLSDWKDLQTKLGYPVPQSLLSEEEAVQQQQADEAKAQMAQRAANAEVAVQESTAQKNMAQAFAAKKAAEMPQGVKEVEMQKTIARQARDIAGLNQQISRLLAPNEQ